MLQTLFARCLAVSLAGASAAALLGLLHLTAGRTLGVKWQYYSWLPVLLVMFAAPPFRSNSLRPQRCRPSCSTLQIPQIQWRRRRKRRSQKFRSRYSRPRNPTLRLPFLPCRPLRRRQHNLRCSSPHHSRSRIRSRKKRRRRNRRNKCRMCRSNTPSWMGKEQITAITSA